MVWCFLQIFRLVLLASAEKPDSIPERYYWFRFGWLLVYGKHEIPSEFARWWLTRRCTGCKHPSRVVPTLVRSHEDAEFLDALINLSPLRT